MDERLNVLASFTTDRLVDSTGQVLRVQEGGPTYFIQLDKMHLFSELTLNHETISDPAGRGDEKLHREIIKKICFSLNNKFKIILAWTT